MRFLVLGAGAWGSALAIHLAHQQHAVVLWGHNPEAIASLTQHAENTRYLPGIPFPSNVIFSSDLAEAFRLAGAQATVLVVVPSVAFDQTTKQIAPFLQENTGIIWATKGLTEHGTFFDEVCLQNCGPRPLAVLSGPSFAKELAQGLPTAVTIATQSPAFGEYLLQAFHSEKLRVYLSQDILGVELGGTIKNVLAIAVGMSDGLGFGANARAALITRGLAELCRLGDKLGAKLPTLMGLSGVGDMVLTCTDNQSRNRRFGLALGQHYSVEDAERSIGQVVEGKANVKQLIQLAAKHQVELPICEQVYAVLYQALSPSQAVENLLKRTPKAEH